MNNCLRSAFAYKKSALVMYAIVEVKVLFTDASFCGKMNGQIVQYLVMNISRRALQEGVRFVYQDKKNQLFKF